jgi:hypothetical protein
MSLMPAILETEQPDKRIKLLVAKKIIEIQQKRKTENRTGPESKPAESAGPPEKEPAQTDLQDIPPGEVRRKSLHDAGGPRSTAAGPEVTKEKVSANTPGFILPWILVFFMLVALIIGTFYFMQVTSELEQEVSGIKDQLLGFQNEVANTSEVINDHLKLVEFFNYTDVRVVNLLPMNEKSDAWGRLLISFESGEGLLQLKNMPGLDGREVYQLWMVSKDVTFPLAAITTNTDQKYYKISNIPYLPPRDIQLFRVTKESGPDISVPEGTAYLYGIFLKESQRRR